MLGALALAAVAYLGLFADLPSPDALITRSSPDTTKDPGPQREPPL